MAYFENPGSIGAGLPTLKRWLENRNKGKSINSFLEDMGVSKVAICDAGDIGLLLFEELEMSDIEVVAFYDRNWEALRFIKNVPVLSLDRVTDLTEDVLIIICPPESYDDIRKYINDRNDRIGTLYLKDLVYEI